MLFFSQESMTMTESHTHNLAEKIGTYNAWPMRAMQEFLRSFVHPDGCPIDPRLLSRIQETQQDVEGIVQRENAPENIQGITTRH